MYIPGYGRSLSTATATLEYPGSRIKSTIIIMEQSGGQSPRSGCTRDLQQLEEHKEKKKGRSSICFYTIERDTQREEMTCEKVV